ncbi:uncharacterized protein LOC124261661 isoform X1 [Haliotis rubra]|uniref:uncharacterized protein LOC124261661 isoform X1 n=1 Tax=Haliotis rubra TaxID=36100 RepID=UPI001EE5A961|nr:uncharacterized protein LOC124261661 isoform X1 [Haliotis rubra]
MAAAADEQAKPPKYDALFGENEDAAVYEPLTFSPLSLSPHLSPPAYDVSEQQALVDRLVHQTAERNTDSDVAVVCLPPPYEPTIRVADSPPSYDSLFGRVIADHNHSSSRIDFLKKFYELLRETLGCTLFLGIIMAVPVTMIVMGCMHLFDCPAEQYIPLYLLVGGIALSAKIIKAFLEMYTCKDCPLFQRGRGKDALEVLLVFFIVGWFIAGNMWIYRTQGQFDSRNPESPNYCSPYVFYFAFWLTTSVYILLALFLCCMYGISALGGKST